MLRYSLARIAIAVPVLFVVALGTFSIFQLLPGGAATAILGQDATPDAVKTLNDALGLNQPLIPRFGHWLGSVLTGNLGQSLTTQQSVWQAISSHAQVTFFLVLYSMIFGIVVGVVVGVLAGAYRRRWWSVVLMGGAAAGISIPRFFLGVLFVLVFAVHLRWFPATGYVPVSAGLGANLHSLVLPCLALGLSQAAHFARVVRASIAEVMTTDYLTYALSKGCSTARVIWRHALPNALTATIMTVAISVGTLISGALVVEVVFALPGLGTLMFLSVQNRDVPVLEGVIMVIAVAYVLSTLLADLAHAALDPRVRRAG